MSWLWKSAIARKLLGSFLVVLIPVTLLSLLVNYISINIVRKEVSGSYQNSVVFLSSQFASSLDKFKMIAENLFSDENISALEQAPEDTSILWDYADLLDKMRFYLGTNDLSGNIGVYLKSKKKLLSTNAAIDTVENNELQLTYQGYESKQWTFKKSFQQDQDVLAYMLGMDAGSMRSVVVTVEINVAQIRNLLKNLTFEQRGIAFVSDTQGYVLSTANSKEIDLKRLSAEIARNQSAIGQFPHNGYRVIYSKLGNTPLMLGMYFPEKEATRPVARMQLWLVSIVIAALGLSIFFIVNSYRNLLLPVHQITNAMRNIKRGNLKFRIGEKAERTELGLMLNEFNRMAAQIEALINEVYLEQIKTQDARLKFLQSQINPHFLYNCLYYIYDMSKAENTEAAAQMSMFLGEYFRYAIKSSRNEVKLKAELANMEIFMRIQKMRYPFKLEYDLHTDSRLDDIEIPRLLIQPLVENAIVHGIEKSSRKMKISVRVEKTDMGFNVTVEDDGNGIEPGRLEEIVKSLDDIHNQSGSLGLSNTHGRLKLKFGDQAGIRIERRAPQGTKVTAVIVLK